MHKQILFTLLMLFSINASAQKVAQKTNLLYLATTTPNLALEFSLGKKLTVDFSAGYNPWDFSGNTLLRHWLVQPELRYWSCQSFEGHFFGVHGIYSKFNLGELSFINSMKEYTYKGSMYGAGIAYGYHFPLNGKWSMELTVGVGYIYLDYNKFSCQECLEFQGSYKRNYWGPTKAGVSLIYMLR